MSWLWLGWFAVVVVYMVWRSRGAEGPPEHYHPLLDCPDCYGNRFMSEGTGRRCADCGFFRENAELDGLDEIVVSERSPSS